MRTPHLIFYLILLLNTFFSIRFFFPLIERDWKQLLVDGLLIAQYILLVYAIGAPIFFPFLLLIFFTTATLKYALALPGLHPFVLRRKIIIDLLGVLLSAATLGGVLIGYPLESTWGLVGVFALANAYLLLIRPMYRL
jgi:hypothetical protein